MVLYDFNKYEVQFDSVPIVIGVLVVSLFALQHINGASSGNQQLDPAY